MRGLSSDSRMAAPGHRWRGHSVGKSRHCHGGSCSSRQADVGPATLRGCVGVSRTPQTRRGTVQAGRPSLDASAKRNAVYRSRISAWPGCLATTLKAGRSTWSSTSVSCGVCRQTSVAATAASLAACVERALAFGVTAAVGWEIAEYFAFLSNSSELPNAYADTLGDLGLRALGAVLAAVAVHGLRRHSRLAQDNPMLTV
jgi:hypothetical protein